MRSGATAAGGRPVGALFREGVMAFVERLLDPERPGGSSLKRWATLWAEMHRLWAGQVLDEMAGAGRLAEAARLAEALRRWCEDAAGLRGAQGSRCEWRKIFPRQDYELASVVLTHGDASICVDGPLLGVRRPAGRGLELFDCRGERNADARCDVLDMAIERKLLAVARPEESPVFMLDYYLPERETVVMSGDELDVVVADRLMPVIMELGHVPMALETAPDVR